MGSLFACGASSLNQSEIKREHQQWHYSHLECVVMSVKLCCVAVKKRESTSFREVQACQISTIALLSQSTRSLLRVHWAPQVCAATTTENAGCGICSVVVTMYPAANGPASSSHTLGHSHP